MSAKKKRAYLLETRWASGFIVYQRLRIHRFKETGLEVEDLALVDYASEWDKIDRHIYDSIPALMRGLSGDRRRSNGTAMPIRLHPHFELQIRKRLLKEAA